MFTRQELEEISGFQNEGSCVVSVYLTVNPVTYPKNEYVTAFKNLVKEELKKYNQKDLKLLVPEIELISEYLTLNKNKFKKGLVLFSSKNTEYWKEFHLSIILNNQIIINQKPYIKPLADLLDNYQRYTVVLVDKESARIFMVHLGEIEEYTEHFSPDVPGKHKKGGWYALSQSRYARHIEKHVTLHLKDVQNILHDILLSREYIGRICIAGPVEATSRFKEILPQPVKEKIVGTFKAEMSADIKEVKGKTLEIMKEVEKEKEVEFIKEIISRTHKGERAALGLDDVVANVSKGTVQKLALKSGFKKSGYRCPSCFSLLTSKLTKCPYCSSEDLESVPYFIDLLVQQAINQGSLIEVIYHNSEEFREAGNIGALLRY